MTPIYITVHNTANTAVGANAKSHASYVKNPDTPTSWHFTVDDTEIYQHLPLNENGWHAGDGNGDGNRKSIGIEICENADGNFSRGKRPMAHPHINDVARHPACECRCAQALVRKALSEKTVGYMG